MLLFIFGTLFGKWRAINPYVFRYLLWEVPKQYCYLHKHFLATLHSWFASRKIHKIKVEAASIFICRIESWGIACDLKK